MSKIEKPVRAVKILNISQSKQSVCLQEIYYGIFTGLVHLIKCPFCSQTWTYFHPIVSYFFRVEAVSRVSHCINIYYRKSHVILLKEQCCSWLLKQNEGTIKALGTWREHPSALLQLRSMMDEAKEMLKSGFHTIKKDSLHTACMLGQRNIGGVVDLRQTFRLKLSCSSNEPSVLHQILANKLCVSYSHWPHPVASPHRSSPPLFFI